MNLTIVYMVAGLSSRFGGKIKQFAKVGPEGETLIEYSVNQAIKVGFNKIVFIIGEHTKRPFKEKFGESYKGIPIEYVLQEYNKEKRDKPWGTCDAVCSAIEKINESFVVCTGDDIYGEKTFEILANHLNTNDDNATATKNLIEMLPEKGSVNRGIFEVDENNYVVNGTEELGISKKNFIEKGFDKNSPVSISIFALQPKTLQLLKEKVEIFKEQNKEDKKIECFMNTELINLIKENKIKMKLYYTPEKWLGVTNPDDEEIVRVKLKQLQ
ncbi:NTP transferase domain-containing protein [Candidatus Pacearchaeota archaeon]|nr:NTP transferase domain-containing protein [Candidatus Pacearchaeota archaeon]